MAVFSLEAAMEGGRTKGRTDHPDDRKEGRPDGRTTLQMTGTQEDRQFALKLT